MTTIKENTDKINNMLESLNAFSNKIIIYDNEKKFIDRTISNINNNVVMMIGDCAFCSCYSLIEVSFPNCTTIGTKAFAYCSTLTSASFPNCTTIGTSAFAFCTNLTSVSFPNCITIGNCAFITLPNGLGKGTNLTSVSFPNCTTIGSDAFANCSNLTSVSFPNCTAIGNSAFAKCSSLTSISLPNCTTIESYTFYWCRNLKALYLTGSSLCSLVASNAFSSTPIGGYSTYAGTYGSIYVLSSLVSAYKSATNWSYYSSRIFAYSE